MAATGAVIEARERAFTRELEEAEESGDPLGTWTKHLSWMEDRQLRGQECYRGVLKRCFAYFAKIPQYHSDLRLAEVCIKLANEYGDPLELYSHMLTRAIGTQYALFYEAYSTALAGAGQHSEALKVLEMGVSRKAHPVRRLQKALDSLKEKQVAQKKQAVTTNPSVINDKAVEGLEKTSSQLPRQPVNESDRNEAFYSQPGVVFAYPKLLVYPKEGGEFQLEQVRASLPQYRPDFPDDSAGEMEMEMTTVNGGIVDMEMTEACPVKITTGAPLGTKPLGGLADVLKMQNGHDKENVRLEVLHVLDQENGPTALRPFQVQRKPLQSLSDRGREAEVRGSEKRGKSGDNGRTAEDELEQLCKEKPFGMSAGSLQKSQRGVSRPEDMDDVDQQLEQLVLAKAAAQKPLAPVSISVAPREIGGEEMKQLSAMRDQENGPQAKEGGFDFTPGTVAGGPNWPMRTAWNGSGFATKLNFSEADSLSSSHAASLAEDGGIRPTGTTGFFNATLEYERRAKLTREQVEFENEFSNDSEQADPEASSWRQQSCSVSGQSFEVFHDSWTNQSCPGSRQHSMRQNTSSAFNPLASAQTSLTKKKMSAFESASRVSQDKRRAVQDVSGVMVGRRRPLGSLMSRSQPGGDLSGRSGCEPSFEMYQDKSRASFQASLGNASSFSVYEDESSIAPFHDSWANNSKQAPRGSFRSGGTGSAPGLAVQKQDSVQVQPKDGSLPSYRMPLGVPLNTKGQGVNPGEHSLAECSFTQFDIRHPSQFEPASTPRGVEKPGDLTCDLSLIPSELSKIEPKASTHLSQAALTTNISNSSRHLPHCSMTGPNLSTIMEETNSYKSSSTSSGGSSTNSTVPPDSMGQSSQRDAFLEDVNPFHPQVVNFMLNSVGYPVHKVEKVPGDLPRFVGGRGITVGGKELSSVKKLVEGGFAVIYTAKKGERMVALKVQNPPLEWEVAVTEKLHQLIQPSSSQFMSACFMEIERAYVFDNASVLVSPYYPYGSLLDLSNAHRVNQGKVDESVAVYFAREMLSIVATLHSYGIIHADIKPDNLMLQDLRQCTDSEQAKGRGLCLIDFGRAVDTTVFPEGMSFVGSCDTEDFQCPEMIEGKHWKWQVDYYGVAGSIYVAANTEYMKVRQNPASGMYRPLRSFPRMYDGFLWGRLFEALLNAHEPLSLPEIIKPFDAKLKTYRSFMFRNSIQKTAATLAQYQTCK